MVEDCCSAVLAKEAGLEAGDPLYLPGRDTVWDAFWLLIGADGALGLYESHLIEDVWSPSGYCFECDAYRLVRDGSWKWSGGGRYWDYSDADQLLGESPIDFSRAIPLNEELYRALHDAYGLA